MSKALSSKILVRTLLSGLVVAAFLLAAGEASAQSARALLRKGNKLFAAGDYRAAYSVFEEGYKKNPSPVFLRSMAFCKLKLYDHKEARKLLKTYLDKFKKTKDRAKLEVTVKNLDDVVQTTIEISSTPPGADIYVDAEATGKVGQTPKTLTIEPGTHTIILRKAGYQVTTKTVAIKARESHKAALALEIPFKATSTPPGADVRIDDENAKPVGQTPYEGGIAPGKHTVYIRKPGFKTAKHELDVQPGAPATVASTLNLGMRIDSKPPGAVVSLDGTKVGSTPVEVAVTPGTHRIELVMDGFRTETREVQVAVGKVSDLSVPLVGGGLLTMRTSVSGATVKVGGMEVGKTPLENAAVPTGKKEVVLLHPDRRTWSQAITFDSNNLVEAKVDMGRKSWPVWVGLGLTAVAATVGTITGIIALGKKDDYKKEVDGQTNKETGQCYKVDPEGNLGSLQDCPYGVHDLSTYTFVAAGVAALATAAYWYFAVRSDETVQSMPRPAATSASLRRLRMPKGLPKTQPSLARGHL